MLRPSLVAVALALCACGQPENVTTNLQTVSSLDVQRFLGRWYDVADFPQRFQENCRCTTAQYDLMPWGEILVRNGCRTGSPTGTPNNALARAWRPDDNNPGQLMVSFVPGQKSPYWVIELDQADYQYAVVSNPERSTLWILSRTPTMEPALLQGILDRLEANGFDLSRLEKGIQDGCE